MAIRPRRALRHHRTCVQHPRGALKTTRPSSRCRAVDAGPLLLVVVAVWCFAVAMAGGVAGLVPGNIRLPVILLAATAPAAGAGANIGISAVAAATAAAVHIRAGRINWRLFAWMTPPSVVGAVAGGLVSGALPGGVLLLII